MLTRRLAPVLVAGMLLAPASAAFAADQTPTTSRVVVVKIDGSVDRTMAGYLSDSLAEAERTDAVLIIQLDSAGTLDQPAVDLANKIFESRVPVVAWVGPAPAKAQGAALLFTSASGLTAVAAGVGVGPLEPVDLVDSRDAEMPDQAALERMAAGWAQARGKPAPSFPSSAEPAQAALDANIAQVRADSLPDLLTEIDGRTVQTATGAVSLHTKIAENSSQQPVSVRFTELGPVDRVLHAVASPAAIYLLLVLGFAALAFEITQPGFGFAGIAGLLMLVLAIYGLTAVPASWVGTVLLLAGIALLTADVVLRRLGALTAIGLVCFVAGSALMFRGVAPAIRVSPWLIAFLAVASLLYYGFGLTVAIKSRERIGSTQRGLVGLVGETRAELKPEGPVYVKGALWRGRSSNGPIPPGTRVRIRGVDGLILQVEPEPGPAGEPPADEA